MMKICCEDSNNRVDVVVDGKIVSKCHVCNCRHFEIDLKPGKLGLRGASL